MHGAADPFWAGAVVGVVVVAVGGTVVGVALVGQDGLAPSDGQQTGLDPEEVPGHLMFVDLGTGERKGHRQARRRAHQVQAQAPEPTRVAGAVAVGSPASQLRPEGGGSTPSTLDRGRVHDPGVVVPEGRVLAQKTDQGPELGRGTSQPLVVAELKRGKAPDTTEMQAVKYAMASRFTTESLGAQFAKSRSLHGDPISDEDALIELQTHAPDLSNEGLRRPRIVLVASEYSRS